MSAPTAAEIDLLRAWIDAGAKGPDGDAAEYPELSTPHIDPAPNVRQYLTSIAAAPDGSRLLLGDTATSISLSRHPARWSQRRSSLPAK